MYVMDPLFFPWDGVCGEGVGEWDWFSIQSNTLFYQLFYISPEALINCLDSDTHPPTPVFQIEFPGQSYYTNYCA